ncbi:hypothetical protein GOODEAATRI_022129 [Goodea atripinnis]|uniref:UPAR/Ly6 domain-containing protein n=1 Tax=Goodea atripinnis TaxID=208336 RepID=A0ABV0P6X1_9TELE
MKNLLICAVFMAMIVTGEALICNSCRVGFKGTCLFASTETCNNSQSMCYKGNLVFNITNMMSLHTRGCLSKALCNYTEVGSLLTAGYTVTRDWFNATGSLTLHSRGCLFSSFCGRTLTGTLIGATYTSTFSCCDTDLCNGATSVQLSLTVAFSVALLSSLWGFWEL